MSYKFGRQEVTITQVDDYSRHFNTGVNDTRQSVTFKIVLPLSFVYSAQARGCPATCGRKVLRIWTRSRKYPD